MPRLRGMFAFAIWRHTNPGTVPRTRSLWYQAALLHTHEGRFCLRLPGQGAARVGTGCDGTGAGGIGGLLSLGKCAGAMDPFPRRLRAAGWPLVAGARRYAGGAGVLVRHPRPLAKGRMQGNSAGIAGTGAAGSDGFCGCHLVADVTPWARRWARTVIEK